MQAKELEQYRWFRFWKVVFWVASILFLVILNVILIDSFQSSDSKSTYIYSTDPKFGRIDAVTQDCEDIVFSHKCPQGVIRYKLTTYGAVYGYTPVTTYVFAILIVSLVTFVIELVLYTIAWKLISYVLFGSSKK